MPIVFADTSALFGLFHPRDVFFTAVNDRRQKTSAEFFYPPWLRHELRHNLRAARVDADGEAAWQALCAAEKHLLRGLRVDLLGQLQRAEKLWETFGAKVSFIGAADVLHVAAALDIGAAEFWTCDDGQAEFARTTGLKVIQFQPS